MDLKVYYESIRKEAAKIEGADAVMVSLATDDGGKAGALMEVPRQIAAKLMVEQRARRASAEETKTFRARQAEAKRKADAAEEASRVKMSLVDTNELLRLRAIEKR